MALIQIKSSSSNASPQTLNVAEPAYSYVSNTLFIGTENSDGVIAIGGKFYLDQQQHIYDTANAAFTQANTTTGSLQTTLQNNINTVDARATAAFIQANAAFAVANSGGASQANAAFNTANAAFIQANTITSVSAQANAAFGVANTALLNSVSASIYANGAFVTANAIDTKVTSASIYANGAFAQANVAINNSLSASNYANAAFAAANSVGIVDGNYANAAFLQANTAILNANTASIYANGAFIQSNVAVLNAAAASIYANGAFAAANVADNKAISSGNYANAAFAVANSAGVVSGNYANAAFTQANTAVLNAASASIYANGAFASANVIDTKVTSASIYANGAFVQANVAINNALSASNYANGAFAAANTVGITPGNYANAGFLVANTAVLNANSASIYANGAFAAANAIDSKVNNASTYANGAFVAANTADAKAVTSGSYANSAFAQANAAFDKANTAVAGNFDPYARALSNTASDVANSALVLAQFAANTANAAIDTTADLTARNTANAAFLTANAAFTAANNATDTYVRNTANAAFARANNSVQSTGLTNTRIPYANATGFLQDSSSLIWDNANQVLKPGAGGTEIGGDAGYGYVSASKLYATGITSGRVVYVGASGLLVGNSNFAFTGTQLNVTGNVAANNIVANGINLFTYANAAFIQANAAFTAANAAGGTVTGNTINLGANTVGQLVSNAVTLTITTKVTDGLALLNNVLGKLVPASPTPFPGGTSLTINSLSTYRMTNFTQTDRTTTGGKSVAAGSTVTSVLRTASYSTNVYNNLGPGDTGTLTLYKDNVSAGAVTFTSASANGTYSDLIITDSKDYAQITGAASGFWRSFDAQGSGSTSNGWNEIYISHSGASNTSTASWYYDDSAPGSPTFTSASISPLSESFTYSSTIPHYNSSTTFKMGVNVAKLSGDMFPTSNTFFTGSAGGAFAAPASNTYPTVGITYPLARNLYVSSGSVTVNTTASITSGFSSSATGPSVTVDNSYSTASQAFTTALANTILYKTGTSSTMEESAITFGSTVGTGSGTAGRIINPGSTDTPAYANNATLFNSQTGTLQTYDATIVAATLKHDQTNYASGYLPVGPNLSSGRTAAQYFTFKFVRTSLSKFNIKFTGTIAGLWVALPGTVIDSTSSLNGWLDMSTAYGGSGIPGANAPGNGSNGCALGGVVTLNSAVSAHSKTCTFGTISSSNSTLSEIYVRIKLTSGQTVTALSLETASN